MVFARDEVLCSPASRIEVEDDRILRGIDSDNHTAPLGSTLEDKLLRLAEELMVVALAEPLRLPS